MAPNPDGKEIAFVVHGEVFVASTEHGDTKRITNTPTQERGVSFSPDGRRLVFAGETEKSWNLYEATVHQPKEEEPYFFASTVVDIKPILANGQENFQPVYSPDGKEVSYLENRTALKVLNLDTKQTRLVLSGDKNYFYSDGDQWFSWSQDGRYFAMQFLEPFRYSTAGGIVSADGKGNLINFTNSGYETSRPTFTKDGRAIIWASDRDGLHSNGEDKQGDIYALFLNQKAYDRFKLSKAEYEIVKKQEDDAKKEKDKRDEATSGGKPKDEDAKKKEEADKKEPVEIEFKDYEDRTVRFSKGSTNLQDAALTPDGEQLIYLSKDEDGYSV